MAMGVDWINLAKNGDHWGDFVNSVMNHRITDMVEYFLTIFTTVGFSGTSYRGDGNAYLPTLLTRSYSDANIWTDGRTDGQTDNRPIRRSWRAVTITFLRNVNSGWSASRRNEINYREFEGIRTKKKNLYCRVQADRSGLGVVWKLEIMSGNGMERM